MNEHERRTELAQFLRSRRERLAPWQVGLQPGTRRRTPGLRREELAMVAGVGTTWYTWLEQGRDIAVSEQVLDSLACALQLDASERAHLFILARQQLPVRPLPLTQTIDASLQLILDAMGSYPALVLNPRWDIIAWNQLACHVFADFDKMAIHERHILWFLFTNSEHQNMSVDWEKSAQQMLALFRASTQRYIGEAWLNELITDLKQASPSFREWWSHHNVQEVQTEHKYLKHPLVGLLTLQAKTFQVADQPDLQMIIYIPVEGTETATRLIALSQMSFPQSASASSNCFPSW
ncbi:helix-turn-helix transcriptional regulator [Ktedonospora formicarum]|uniref:Transcriptional regulator n=1 Tax=Ktedonospora formicarum TaxID=2778364 RepID=A0A8J3MXC5_9CHLR|nr:helix-turn-helix transcriptional regulator [Ktedonospora formicarum]GHO49841.1 transcriptional regulator [Ktedonospora formicarum]